MSPARTQTTTWRLKPLHVPGLTGLIDPQRVRTIGRDRSNDVAVDEARFPQVSSHHARVVLERGVLVVEDLGSTNGTFVNGRQVERAELASGDTVQFGCNGPRFVALRTSDLDSLKGPQGLGSTRIVRAPSPLRRRFVHLGRGMRRDVRRTAVAASVLFGVVAAGCVAGVVYLKHSGDEERARLQGMTAQIQRQLEDRLREAGHRLEEQAAFWDDQRADLQEERDALLGRIAAVDGVEHEASLEELRAQLAETQQYLAMFDPVGIEQQRLEQVARVRRSVVLIEKKIVYRDPASGRVLHFERDADEGEEPLNFEGRGEPLTLDESTGSGFCISPEGWVVTNAHVLDFTARNFPVSFADGVELVPERELAVIFTDESERHPARVVDFVQSQGLDLGLLEIEGYDGMPCIDGLDLERTIPEPGSEVYLFGFPLGHHALQEGDRVIASTFKGILSRYVAPFLQVDAGVYPGNSGGPLTDASGNAIGIIFSVQNNLDGTTAANIGYAIPIHELSRIWPPRPDALTRATAAPAPVAGE